MMAIVGLCVFTAFFVGCGEHLQESTTPRSLTSVQLLSPDESTILLEVEIAREPAEHARGLMFREGLAEGQGMLFVFEQARILNFWMKNTLLPLDVLFFDAEGRLLSSETMIPCELDPCPQYASQVPAVYALEVAAGFVEEQGVGARWSIDLGNL